MNTPTRFALAATLSLAWLTAAASAHDGRRLEVVVLGNRLAVQGFISTGQDDAGGGVVRPYYNAIHQHLNNLINPIDNSPIGVSVADLPGFDVFAPNADEGSFIAGNAQTSGVTYAGIESAPLLAGATLTLQLDAITKWENVGTSLDNIEDRIEFVALDDNDPAIRVHLFSDQDEANVVGTENLGSLTLATDIATAGATDLDLDYEVAGTPTDTIYALEWTLSAGGHNGIADSETIYTLLAPDPTPGPGLAAGLAVGRHFQTLAAERFLGTPATAIAVPEPATAGVMGLALVLAIGARRRGPNQKGTAQ